VADARKKGVNNFPTLNSHSSFNSKSVVSICGRSLPRTTGFLFVEEVKITLAQLSSLASLALLFSFFYILYVFDSL